MQSRVTIRNLKNVHLESILKLHTEFQIPSLIWKGDMEGTNSKNEKN